MTFNTQSFNIICNNPINGYLINVFKMHKFKSDGDFCE